MALGIKTKDIDVNRFWETTPTALKYLFLIAVIIVGLYFLFSRKIDNSQVKELDKIEQNIEVTYHLVEKFQSFQSSQLIFNEQVKNDMSRIYTLVYNLNSNVNTQFDYVIKSLGKNNSMLNETNILLKQNSEMLIKSNQPVSTQTPAQPSTTHDNSSSTQDKQYSIGVKRK